MQQHSGLLVLPFDREAADWLGCERARLETAGNTPPYADAEIAAIAVTQKLVLVTRNTRDFRLFEGLSLENWFSECRGERANRIGRDRRDGLDADDL